MKNLPAILGAASLGLTLPVTPAHAGSDITNFNVRNCTDERIFVCSFDKTDSLMTIPYKAAGVPSDGRKEFGCASLNKCKVIIGVSKKTAKKTLSTAMEASLSTGAVSGAGVSATGAAVLVAATPLFSAGLTEMVALSALVGGAVIAVVAGGTVAGIEIADGWKDGDVCNQVRKAAQKAGMKPKSFMKDGKVYRVVERYATDKDGKPYVNPDGTAVLAYATEQEKGQCPDKLKKQLIGN